MKYLSHYIQDAQTKAFNDNGAFFAFSNEQLKRSALPDVEYVNVGAGLIAPKDKAVTLLAELDRIHEAGIQQDIADNGIDAIIRRELWNHEAFYTWSIDDTADALKPYGVNQEQVRMVFIKMVDEGAAQD